jgi:hypothetical protein
MSKLQRYDDLYSYVLDELHVDLALVVRCWWIGEVVCETHLPAHRCRSCRASSVCEGWRQCISTGV